jgi:hypothetical protein
MDGLLVPIESGLTPVTLKDGTVQIREEEVLGGKICANKFLGMLHLAYANHLIPCITPDDVHLLIMSQFAQHVNENTEFYRAVFTKDPTRKDKEIITIYRNLEFKFDDVSQMIDVFQELLDKISEKSPQVLRDLECTYSTTTLIKLLTSQVTLAYMVEKFYQMRMILSCGFPAVNIRGTRADWLDLSQKLDILEGIAAPKIKDYLQKCKKVVSRFIGAYDDDPQVDQIYPQDNNGNNISAKTDWSQMYYSERCGSGGQSGFSGWILDLLNKNIGEGWKPYDEPDTRITYVFKIGIDVEISSSSCGDIRSTSEPLFCGDLRSTNDISVQLNIGPVGLWYDAEKNLLSMKYDYFFEAAQVKGWMLDDVEVAQKVIKWQNNPGIYGRVKYWGKLLHESIDLPDDIWVKSYKPICIFVKNNNPHILCESRDNDKDYYYETKLEYNNGKIEFYFLSLCKKDDKRDVIYTFTI